MPLESVPPTAAQRLAMRERPPGPLVMHQQWRDLLFLHWRYPAAAIQATLPPGLFVDCYDGEAYLGIVPFTMRRVRPRFLPPVPGLSDFLELNLRTYVHDEAGVPGVWFYSLDANQRLAVAIARGLFHLPYEHAEMAGHRTPTGEVTFQSRRRGNASPYAASRFGWAPMEAPWFAEPDTLEFFLAERYRLYSVGPTGLRRGAVHHAPYPLCRATVTQWDEALLPLNGFAPTNRAPDHVLCSPGVEVAIMPLQRVSVADLRTSR